MAPHYISENRQRMPRRRCTKTEAGLKNSHQDLWSEGPDGPWLVSLTNGLDEHGKAMFGCTEEDWKKELTSGDGEKYQEFLKTMNLTEQQPIGSYCLGSRFRA